MARRAALLLLALLLVPVTARAADDEDEPAGPLVAARHMDPVVVTGDRLPAWSRLAAVGAAEPWPSGALTGERSVHDLGTRVVPPDVRKGVDLATIAAFRWDDALEKFVEIPVQVDERFPYFLANRNSDFGIYSAVDYELTYAWDTESWKKTAGTCEAEYPVGEMATPDPVPTLDDDDEIVFMAPDAGPRAADGALGPPATGTTRQELTIVDPLTGETAYVYLFLRAGGSSFTADTGYVDYRREADADTWIDRHSFAADDPEKLGSSNTGYGPNLAGTVCDPGAAEPRASTDRFPRDGVTVATDTYRFYASGRWMVRDVQVARPDAPGTFGPDLVDRWKGRAFQQSPDSAVSLVGFEDEQVNWEANSALLGERAGPVRAIREVWGADSGTNVTKTEIFYRDAFAFRHRLRVHPIPPDGIYTMWDHNAGVATTYFNALHPEGIAIDGVQDDVGTIDEVAGFPAYFDIPDPTHDVPIATLKWDQVSADGDAGSIVYLTELKGATSALNPVAAPYYRDDACFDDGTGDDPVPRPSPGDPWNWGDAPCDERQGAWGSTGLHVMVTHDTDNLFVAPVPVTEVDAIQWQFPVPAATPEPAPVGEPYAQSIRVPLQVLAGEQPSTAGEPEPETEPTALALTGDDEGQATDPATLAAVLVDSEDTPIEGATVAFDFQGTQYEATTDGGGQAEVEVVVSGPAGAAPVDAAYAGDGFYEASAASGSFTVHEDDAVLELTTASTGPPHHKDVQLRAELTDGDSGVGVAGRTVVFTLNGDQIATVETDHDGVAEAVAAQLKPNDVLGASFAGDGTYAPAEASVVWTGRPGPPPSSPPTRPALAATPVGGGLLLLMLLMLGAIGFGRRASR